MRIRVAKDAPLHELLHERFPETSNTSLRKWLKNGRVLVEGRAVSRFDLPLRAGQDVEVVPSRSVSERPPFPVLFRDRHLLVVEKPVGLLSVSRDEGGDDTFTRRLQEYVHRSSEGRERIFVVHRLDRETSGIMLFALSAEIRDRLQGNWEETEKRYWALVEGKPPEDSGTIRSFLKEDRNYRVHSCGPGDGGKLAITHYRVQRAGPGRTLLEVHIETGRKNQIRAHLSELGCPIVGDAKYGARTNPIRRLGLHAFLLSFPHPVSGERVLVRTAMPASFRS